MNSENATLAYRPLSHWQSAGSSSGSKTLPEGSGGWWPEVLSALLLFGIMSTGTPLSCSAVGRLLSGISKSCCGFPLVTWQSVVVRFGGKLGFGHEQRIMQGLAAALQQEQLQLEARQVAAGSDAASADAAVLFYRVASRLDVRDVLQQAQALRGGDEVTQTVIVLAHNVPTSQIRSKRKDSARMADGASWLELIDSKATIIEVVFDEDCWPAKAPQNVDAIKKLAKTTVDAAGAEDECGHPVDMSP